MGNTRSSLTDRSEQGQSFGRVIDVLEAIGALYAIWGGLAVIVYGEPRFTMDMDVLLSHHNFAAPLFIKRLQENNYHLITLTRQPSTSQQLVSR